MKGHEALIGHAEALGVRSKVVKQTANLDIDSHWDELCKVSSVVRLLTARRGSMREQFREHIDRFVDEHYSTSVHYTVVGAVADKFRQAVSTGGDWSSSNVVPKSSGALGPGISKKAIWADTLPSSPQNVFDGVHLMVVTKDSEAADAHAPDTMAQEVLHKVSG